MSNWRDVLWAIDMDRTLLDIDRTFEALTETVERLGLADAATLARAKYDTEQSGGSFDALGYLQGIGLREDDLRTLCEAFVAAASPAELLYGDALPFLVALDERRAPTLIVTHGSKDWQTAKLRAAGLHNRPYLITSQKHKGELIATWRTTRGYMPASDNTGELVPVRAVVLVDDKAVSFQGWPADCVGYWLRRLGAPDLGLAQSAVPSIVHVVESLSDIIDQLELSDVGNTTEKGKYILDV